MPLLTHLILPVFMLCAVSVTAQQRLPVYVDYSESVAARTVYRYSLDRDRLYASVSKVKRTLYVYERRATGTVLIAAYPICLAENYGNKQRRGDHRTPESQNGEPFHISEIVDASNWRHDFGDGRGCILAYGKWFMRLAGDIEWIDIGIHGSTGNQYSVPGRGSEGCIRLRDEDIVHFYDNYAYVGMEVYIDHDPDD